MTQFDPTAIGGGVSETINRYDGPAPALIFEAYRDGISVRAATGTVGRDDPTPATTDDKFEIGSQTKMMTTTVLLQLVDAGHFSLDDRLADVMDVTPLSWMPNIEEVTLRQLMTHKSGIPDYRSAVEVQQGMVELLSQDPPQPIGIEEFLQLFEAANLPAIFEPGAKFSYTNTGFTLLGLLIEATTGNSLADEFQTRIFDPVGMSSTSLPEFVLPDGVLKSYLKLGDAFFDVTDLPIAELGEGGGISTTGDMIRFMKALVIDGTLVPESQMGALEEFFTPEPDSEDGEIIGHQGATDGTISHTLVHLPSGTILSASETMRYGQTGVSDEVFEAIGNLMENPAWTADYADDGSIAFAASAADFDVRETVGTDGSAETRLTIDGVTLTLDGALSELDTNRFSFEDGSILFVADEGGSRFHVGRDARAAATADTQLIGLSGDDDLGGGRRDDRISGGEGDDDIAGNRGDDHLSGGDGDDNISGGRGDDRLDGGSGDDVLKGGRGQDALSGGSGDDILRGGRGDDRLESGAGDDVLIGGHGADTFVFTLDGGNDVIRGFDAGKDQIDLIALNVTFEDLQISEGRGGRRVEIEFEDVSLVITGAQRALTEDDFLF